MNAHTPRNLPLPLLALHGFTGSGADFQWLAAQTADLLDWHTYDLPGHGRNLPLPVAAGEGGGQGNTRKGTEPRTQPSSSPRYPLPYSAAATARAIDAALTAAAVPAITTLEPLPQKAAPTAEVTLTATPSAETNAATLPPAKHSAPPKAALPAETSTATRANGVTDYRPDTAASRTRLPLLLGYSMGGRMALRYLARYGTAKAGGLILIGASAGINDAAERRERRRADHALADRIEAEGVDAFMRYWNSLPLIASQRTSPLFEPLQALRRHNRADGLANSLRGIGTGALAPLHARLPAIRIPCLLLTGEQDEKFTTIARELARSLPTAQHVCIAKAGHSPHWEAPQATADAIRHWVRAHFD